MKPTPLAAYVQKAPWLKPGERVRFAAIRLNHLKSAPASVKFAA